MFLKNSFKRDGSWLNYLRKYLLHYTSRLVNIFTIVCIMFIVPLLLFSNIILLEGIIVKHCSCFEDLPPKILNDIDIEVDRFRKQEIANAGKKPEELDIKGVEVLYKNLDCNTLVVKIENIKKETVVLKRIFLDELENKDHYPLIQITHELEKELEHENIANVIAARVTTRLDPLTNRIRKILWVVSEYLENHLLDFNFTSEEDIKNCLKGILAAIQYLHSRNVIHLDIGLKSIMYAKDKHGESIPKFLDIGYIAYHRLLHDGTAFRDVRPPFYSKKPGESFANYGKGDDIFSVGALALILSKKMAENCTKAENKEYSPLDVLGEVKKIKMGELNFPDNISEELEKFIRDCCKSNVNERLSAKDLQFHSFICPLRD